MLEGYIVAARTRVCNKTVLMLAVTYLSKSSVSSSFCFRIPSSEFAKVLGQSRLLKVVNQTARVSRFLIKFVSQFGYISFFCAKQIIVNQINNKNNINLFLFMSS